MGNSFEHGEIRIDPTGRCPKVQKNTHIRKRASNILLKKVDSIYHIITLPLPRSLLMSEQVGVIIRKAKPYFQQNI